jgi:ClpP class serine protease
VVFVDGMMASAALYIGSYADYIIAKRESDIIGSIGTMIELQSFKNIDEDKQTGERVVRIYADQSTEKNKAFEEAINNLNFIPIKEKILNPHNERFIADMKANRPNIKDTEITGETFNASEVVGTLIDEVGSFETAVNKILELSKIKNFNLKTSKFMNKEQLKQEHSSVYTEVVNEGVVLEKQRVEAWLAFEQVDMAAVKAGIESGENVNQKVIATMAAKAMANATLQAIEKQNPVNIQTGIENKIESDEQKAIAKFEAELRASMNLK